MLIEEPSRVIMLWDLVKGDAISVYLKNQQFFAILMKLSQNNYLMCG